MKSTLFLQKTEQRLRALRGLWNHRTRCCLIEDPVDLFYVTGLKVSRGALLVSKGDAVFFLDGRYAAKAKKELTIEVRPLETNELRQTLIHWRVDQLLFDSDKTTYQRFNELKDLHISLVPEPNLLKFQRAEKDAQEIQAMKKSAALNWAGFLFTKKKLRAGMTERAAAWIFESYCRERGAQGMAFEPIIAFGKNASYPHHRAGSTVLKRGDLILIDIGVTVDNYQSDMTRTFFFGKAGPKWAHYIEVVQNAAEAALQLCRPGVKIRELDQAARHSMKRESLDHLFTHSLGHGVGLEIHEFPSIRSAGLDSDELLREGMILTIEPGLYLPGVGGVRHEDTVLITKEGYRNFYPKSK